MNNNNAYYYFSQSLDRYACSCWRITIDKDLTAMDDCLNCHGFIFPPISFKDLCK